MTYPYALQPPDINSGMVWTGPGSGPLAASAAAWQELAAQMGSSGAAFQSVIEALTSGPWLGPSSITMAGAAAPFVVWMIATATQAEQAAMSAAHAAMIFEAAHAGVVPPAEIEANHMELSALVASNFMGCNTGPIAANIADYHRMWSQDATVMQTYSADAAMNLGQLGTFVPPVPTTDPIGMATQATSVAQANATGAGNTISKIGNAGSTAVPGGMDSMLSMGPQLMSSLPSVLQGLAQPLTSGGGLQGLSGFQSLLSPFMSMFSGGMFGGAGTGATAIPAAAGPAIGGGGGLGGLGGLGGGVSAAVGRGGSLGGLSVPATWAASAQTTGATGQPVVANAATPEVAAPTTGGAGMGTGGAPIATMAGHQGNSSDGPRYGTPIRVLPRPR